MTKKKEKTYVDGYVLALPKKNLGKYKKMAQEAGKMWKRHGALEYVETIIDDENPKGVIFPFSKMIKLKEDETIIFAYVVYKSKAHRNQVNKKVMSDPLMNEEKFKDMPMPFEMKRMAYAGFKVIVHE